MGKLSLRQDVILAATALITKQTSSIVRIEPELITKFLLLTSPAL